MIFSQSFKVSEKTLVETSFCLFSLNRELCNEVAIFQERIDFADSSPSSATSFALLFQSNFMKWDSGKHNSWRGPNRNQEISF